MGVALVVFLVNLGVRGPMIQPDEGSYLANAAALAGFPNDLESSYHAGYSMIIAPAFWLAETPQGVWLAVKAINALLFALTVAGLWLTAKQLKPNADDKSTAIATGLVSLYPMWLVMSGYSFAQIAFVPAFLFMFLAYLRAITGGLWAWTGLGLISGFLYWIHPTAIVPIIAVLAGAAYIALSRRNFVLFAGLLLGLVPMGLIYPLGIVPWLHAHMNISGLPPILHYPGLAELLAPLTSFDGLHSIITHASGQLFYLSVGTFGLVWLGLFSVTPWARDSAASDHDTPLQNTAIAILAGISLFGVIGLSVLIYASLPLAEHRLDHWIYGRYVEGVIAPILLLGVLTPSFRKLLWVVPIATVCAMILWVDLVDYTHVAPFNISAFWQDFWLREQGLWVWLASGCSLIVVVALLPRKMAMAAVGLIFAGSSYLQLDWHKSASEAAMGRWSAALQIREQFVPGTCVGFEHTGIDSYGKRVFWSDIGFALFDYPMKRMTSAQWSESCDGPLLSYQKDIGIEGVAVYPLALSHQGGPGAWARGTPPAGLSPISWDGEAPIRSQVGSRKGSGIESDGRDGFLIFGPYQPIMAGTYDLQVTGRVHSNGDKIEVDLVEHPSGTTLARFKGLGNHRGADDSRLLQSRVVVRNDVAELEVRVHVEEDAEVYIDGYSLKLIANEADAQ